MGLEEQQRGTGWQFGLETSEYGMNGNLSGYIFPDHQHTLHAYPMPALFSSLLHPSTSCDCHVSHMQQGAHFIT